MSLTGVDGPLYRRWWKVWPFPACCLPCNPVLHPCRAGVSQNKTRFRQDGFDLDLTYVTKRIIVHGFPATGVEHIYRNPRTEVQRLLDKYHLNHYKVYNFANEPGRTYPEQLFQGRVERYPFTDHTCPPLESVVDFCENAKAWLDMDENNVVSLHCKAGKGRAGIMAACLMVRLGETAEAAVTKFDATRVSDLKGLTVVNQRKWVFMYERLVKEVWGLQETIGMVPGQDPDLRAPTVRPACFREISVQLHMTSTGGKRSNKLLPNLSIAMYQQEPMGKTLVHRGKMQQVVPAPEEPGVVFAAALPRSAVVQGTFQILVSAAVGTAATQRGVMDLWWNTTFLSPEGGDQVYELSEMDVSPLKLEARLRQAGTRIILRHTQPNAASPPRRTALKRQAVGSEPSHSHAELAPQLAPPTNAEGAEASRRDASDRSLRAQEKHEAADPSGTGNNDAAPAAGVDPHGDRRDSEAEPTAKDGGGVELAALSRNQASRIEKQDSVVGPSPAFPGPSPAGWASPVWTFEGRVASAKDNPAGIVIGDSRWERGDSRWERTRMWANNQGISSGGVSTPAGSASRKKVGPAPGRSAGLREKRRSAQRKRSGSDSIGSAYSVANSQASAGSTFAPTGTMSSMRTGGAEGAVPSRGAEAEKGFAFAPQRDTDSDSDDQLAVRASAFGGPSMGGGGGVKAVEGHFAVQGPAPVSASTGGEQWAIEMEMEFAQEKRRWEEHQYALEKELEWALAARARAEARSEEDSARVEVLESRLSAWRSEYAVIERDVKQAVKLLEMSLSGLMSAESALKQWKAQIPAKAYEDIMACLTKGDIVPTPFADQE